MGNEVSSSEEEQEEPMKESDSELSVEVKNGPVTLKSSPTVNSAPGANDLNSQQVVQQENITSSQKTIVLSPISNGSVTNPPPPAAKSKFRLTISRPSPGRTSFQPNGQGDVGPVKPEITLQESPVVQTQLMAPIDPDSTVVKENGGGIQNQASPFMLSAEDASLSSTNPTEEESASTKNKEVSIFHKIFKPEKKMQSTVTPEVTINQPVLITVDQNAAVQSSAPSNNLQTQSVDDYDQSESAQEQSKSEATQSTTPEELHPVMSFFKTLVTPNKSVPKSEEEVKTEGEDKSKKNEQLADGSKVVLEQSVVSVSVNSEKSTPEQVLIQDPKSSDVSTQITSSEEGKAAKESTASRPKLFWRKSFKGEPQPNKIQENGVEEQAEQSVTVNTTPEQISLQDKNPLDSNVQPQENEKLVVEPSSRSVPFWRKSLKGDSQPRKNQDNVVIEQPVASVSLNLEKLPSEQVITPETKPLDSETQLEIEKPQKEAAMRPVPFWRKSFKSDPPPQKVPENVVVEQPIVSVSVNSEKSPPEQVITSDNKALDSETQQSESEKPQKEATARPMPFWRKSFKGDPQTPSKVQEISLPEEPQAVQLTLASSSEPEPQSSKTNTGGAASGSKTPENKRPEDGKTSKPKIMMFFKQLSVLGDTSNISPEESTEKSNQEPTLDITDGVEVSKNDKTVVTAVVEPPPPPPQKGKDNMKEKKASAEKLNKQESRESAEAAASIQLQNPDPVQVDIGVGTSKDGQLKRTEKRQSLGSFFKAIGPKRMCDAEVQTDPVTILPAEKTK